MAQRTIRADVPSSDAQIIPGVYAPSNLDIGNTAERQAAALSNALGLVADAYGKHVQRVHAKAELAGTQAALEGRDPTPDEAARDHFVVGYEKVRTDRTLIELEAQANEFYQSNPKATPDELQHGLDQIYQQHFGGLDPEKDVDRAVMARAAEGWSRIVAGVNHQAGVDYSNELASNTIADLGSIAQNEYAKTGTVDVSALHDRISGLMRGPHVNAAMSVIVRDIAERNGAPELIDSLPDRWSDGTPSLKHIPQFVDQLRSSRDAAENQRLHDQNLSEKLATDQLKAARESNAEAVVAAVLKGRSMTRQITDLVSTGALTSEQARDLVSFQRTTSEHVGRGEPNPGESASMEIKIRTGQAGLPEVVQAAADGKLGYGQAGREDLTRLLGLTHEVRNDVLKTAEAEGYRAIVKARTRPTQSLFAPDFDGSKATEQAVVQATALRDFDQALLAGQTPPAAMNAALAAGKTPPADKGAPAITDPEDIRQLVQSGAMSEDEAIELLNAAQ